jgi:hypothetical protein
VLLDTTNLINAIRFQLTERPTVVFPVGTVVSGARLICVTTKNVRYTTHGNKSNCKNHSCLFVATAREQPRTYVIRHSDSKKKKKKKKN